MRFGAKHLDDDTLSIHLGSTGCIGEMTDVERCMHPNRSKIKLDVVDPKKAISLHLDSFLSEPRDLNDRKWGCMSERDDVGCQPIFQNLGLGDNQDGLMHRLEKSWW